MDGCRDVVVRTALTHYPPHTPDNGPIPPPLGNDALRGVVGSIHVYIGHVAKQNVTPRKPSVAQRGPREPLHCAMHAEMHHSIGLKIILGVCGGEWDGVGYGMVWTDTHGGRLYEMHIYINSYCASPPPILII